MRRRPWRRWWPKSDATRSRGVESRVTCRVEGVGTAPVWPCFDHPLLPGSLQPSFVLSRWPHPSSYHCPIGSSPSCQQYFFAMAAKDAKAQEAVRKLEEYIEKYVSFESPYSDQRLTCTSLQDSLL